MDMRKIDPDDIMNAIDNYIFDNEELQDPDFVVEDTPEWNEEMGWWEVGARDHLGAYLFTTYVDRDGDWDIRLNSLCSSRR